ncbi:helicase associated domain-containing protein [Streptomyces sp. NPDC020192]|uniref:helicase associated domain-containing protein n=1 Tax=Streptomyces sp. NPDC020192 TaxID=3365066 RepID=UPI00378F1763
MPGIRWLWMRKLLPYGWPASLAGFPLGQWIADARRFYARGDMDAARGWAAENGHLLAPLDATHQGYRVGIWLKNQRAAARKAAEIEQRRAEGLPVGPSARALSEGRRKQLEDIDPSWCPAWPVEWQRAFHLVRQHLEAGGELPMEPGTVVHQGEDLGRWVKSIRLGWDKLTTVQQWICEQVLGIEPAGEDEKPQRRTQADTSAMDYEAPSSITSAKDTCGCRESTSNGSSSAASERARRSANSSSGPGSAISEAGQNNAAARARRAALRHRHALDIGPYERAAGVALRGDPGGAVGWVTRIRLRCRAGCGAATSGRRAYVRCRRWHRCVRTWWSRRRSSGRRGRPPAVGVVAARRHHRVVRPDAAGRSHLDLIADATRTDSLKLGDSSVGPAHQGVPVIERFPTSR